MFHEGTPPLAVYCVHSGLIKLTRHVTNDGEAIVGLATGGDLLGHRAVLSGESTYGVSACAVEASVVCTIPRADFLRFVQGDADLAYQLLTRLAREFRYTEGMLVERCSASVTHRAANLLITLVEAELDGPANGGPKRIPTRRADLAALVGATPETLSRTLHELARRDLIEITRTDIKVRDIDGLRRLVGRPEPCVSP
jgi:CRP/FNR family transcriptional regulator